MTSDRANEVLTVLNGMQSVDLDSMEFCVITGTAREGDSYWPFERGEVLVVDKLTGREPFGEGRKPAKWDVEAEYVPTLDEAVAIRQRAVS